MSQDKWVSISKFLSLVLRHKPETIGVQMDAEGWVEIDDLLDKMKAKDKPLSFEDLKELVADNKKQRFIISEDGQRIRANQGHSVSVDLKLEALVPPSILYHGTATKNLDSIRKEGLLKGKRQHVHLSPDRETAIAVGSRHGKPAVLEVRSGDMHADGIPFYQSANGVWLCDHVPHHYLNFPDNACAFAVLYRFDVKPGMEEQFLHSWTELTRLIYRYEGSLGSRLHQSTDGAYIAYAQWPNREQWANSGNKLPSSAQEWRDAMKSACHSIETMHELEVKNDLLKSHLF